jgi:hypothetical protein
VKQELHFVRLGLVMAAVLVAAFVAWSAPDSPSHSIASGGGTSSGGSFTISGTIGQADAGLAAGGAFAVEGGFWGGAYAVQSIGAPFLSITGVGANFLFTWPDANASFVLESANSLTAPVTWTFVPNAPVDSNGQRSVTLPGTSGIRFYRLRKQ